MQLSAKAFLFDLNGTIINDMAYHTKVWHQLLNDDLGAGMTYEEVKLQMYGKNDELFVRVFGEGHFTQEEMNHWSMEKERRYQQVYRPHMQLLPGLQSLLDGAAAANIRMAIGSAAIPFNIDFVLDGLELRKYFPVVVSALDVAISKPHPDTFLRCAEWLQVDPVDCIVFEDAPKGVEAAHRAGMRAVVLTTAHPIEDFAAYPNVIGYGEDYTGFHL